MLDASLAAMGDRVTGGEALLVGDEALATLARDIPDLRVRLGLGDQSEQPVEVAAARMQRTVTESVDKINEGVSFLSRGVRLLGTDVSSSATLFWRAVGGDTLKPREVQTLRRTGLDVFTFVPFIIILILPLTPVGHVLIFSFIQRYFPGLFPSQFTERRQELMRRYEDLRTQLAAAEADAEKAVEEDAYQRALTAIEGIINTAVQNTPEGFEKEVDELNERVMAAAGAAVLGDEEETQANKTPQQKPAE